MFFKKPGVFREERLCIPLVLFVYIWLAGENFNLVVAFHPRENEVIEDNFPLDSLADKLAMDISLNVVGLNRRFAQTGLITKNNSAGFYWKTDLHHNAEGYKIMGDLIADFIRTQELVCN